MPAADKKPKVRGVVKFFLALAVLAAAGAGIHHWRTGGAGGKGAAKVTYETIKSGDIEEVVTAQGKLEPKDYVDVGVQVSGQIKKLYVDIGDIVKKGDLIAEIDPRVYQSKVEADGAHVKTLQAQLDQQEAQVALAQQQYDRTHHLYSTKAVSQDADESAETALKVAKAQRDALNAQIEEQNSELAGDQANLSYTKIFAPMDGTIVIEDAKEGQTLNAAQSAPRVVQIADLDTMTVRAQVAEADIMRIKPGEDVYFTTLGSGKRRWNGAVRQVLPSPEVINEVVLYDVLVDVDNKDRQLMTGMSTQTFFVMGQAKGVPLVPVAALGRHMAQEDSDAGAAYRVRVLDGGKKAERVIRVGLMNRTVAEVKEGLQEGDQVVVETAAEPDGSGKPAGGGRGMRSMPRL